MKKAFYLLSFLLLLTNSAFATYSTDWIRPADNYQKTGTMIARDAANNAIVTGYIVSNGIYTRKYDKFGNLLWEKSSSSGIQSVYEKSVWVNTDASNNVFVAGYQYPGQNSSIGLAVVALKYSPTGTLLWKQVIPVNFLFGFNLRSAVDAVGNLYIGTCDVNHPGLALMKFDPAGNLLFFNASETTGGSYNFHSMRLKGDRVVLSGGISNVASAVAYVTAFDLSGNALWQKSVFGHSGVDVEMDATGNAYLLTSHQNQVSATSGEDVMLYKFSAANGTQLWLKKYHFGGTELPQRFTLVGTKISFICAGTLTGGFDWVTFQTNLNGVMLWNTRYTGLPVSNDQYPYFIAAKTNGEVFVTGKGGPTPTPNSPSNMRMITLKYGNTGAVQWVDSLNYYNGWGVACVLASDNSLFVVSGNTMTAIHLLDHTGTGSCGLPTNLNAINITTTKAKFTWTGVTGAYLYHVKYKPAGAAQWTTVGTNLKTITISTLTPGTTYNYAVEAVCSSGPSGFSATQTFSTTGVGYCTSSGQSQAQEWLYQVVIGGINNFTTAPPTSGYTDYTNLSANLVRDSAIPGYISGAVPYPESEYYRVWIDYNHDFDFTDPGELVADVYSSNSGYINVGFTVPANATLGATRMRIIESHDAAPAPCGTYTRGETEDYTVVITTSSANPIAVRDENTIAPVSVTFAPNPFTDILSVQLGENETNAQVSIFDITGKLQRTLQVNGSVRELDLSELNSGVYIAKVQINGKPAQVVKIIKQ